MRNRFNNMASGGSGASGAERKAQDGNGRAVRNVVEMAKRRQALRLVKMKTKKTIPQLCTLEVSDLQF